MVKKFYWADENLWGWDENFKGGGIKSLEGGMKTLAPTGKVITIIIF